MEAVSSIITHFAHHPGQLFVLAVVGGILVLLYTGLLDGFDDFNDPQGPTGFAV